MVSVIPTRYTGTVQFLAEFDAGPLVAWISAIPLADWPQQRPLDDGQLRPAMVSDPAWHGMEQQAAAFVRATLAHFGSGVHAAKLMVSVVMPGQDIAPHVDVQPPYWIARVHLPLVTNDESRFIVGGEAHHMEVGKAYLVNTEVEHSVENAGPSPRIHLMYDVYGATRTP